MSYLTQLTLRLAAGAMRLPENLRLRHARFFEAAQRPDGGFPGRQGASDPYYTGFALRGLALIGLLEEDVARRAASFLQSRLDTPMASVDFVSLVYSAVLLEVTHGIDLFRSAGHDRQSAVSRLLDRFRCDDGGYAKTETNRRSSTYHTFLAVMCQELVGIPIENAQQVADLVRSHQRDDGGFVEVTPLGRSGTNPTAAAIGLLRLLDSLDESVAATAAQFLSDMQNLEGGLRANGRIPVADLLSTFTGIVALADLGRLASIDLEAARRYVESLALADGGFRGGAWDDSADVEYTFYGLGSLALMASAEP